MMSLLKGGELMDEGRPDFQFGPPRVKKLQRLQQSPFVLLHEVDSDGTRGSTLSSDRVNKNTLSFAETPFNEVI